MTEATPSHTNELRVVVDAQIALAMFLVRRDLPTAVPTTFAAEVRFLAAGKLFEMGKLSSGKAAEMAGIGRVAFLHNCSTVQKNERVLVG